MEAIQEIVPEKGAPVEPLVAAMAAPVPARASLPPKGACWSCDKPLDSVRRFCGKSCASSFDEEAEFTR